MCKGSTADSDSVCLGSNPRSPAIKRKPTIWVGFLFYLWLGGLLIRTQLFVCLQTEIGCASATKVIWVLAHKGLVATHCQRQCILDPQMMFAPSYIGRYISFFHYPSKQKTDTQCRFFSSFYQSSTVFVNEYVANFLRGFYAVVFYPLFNYCIKATLEEFNSILCTFFAF